MLIVSKLIIETEKGKVKGKGAVFAKEKGAAAGWRGSSNLLKKP